MGKSEGARDLESLLEYIRDNRGFDFTGYKRPSLDRRIRKRMADARIKTLRQYRDYLDAHPEEFTLLFNTILINVTAFFRDPAAWDFLRAEIIPKILAAGKPAQSIRAWSPGCASGEEPYTLAMVLAEAMGEAEFHHRVKIYATDMDQEALRAARRATFTAKAVAGGPAGPARRNISSRRAIPTPSGATCATPWSSAGMTCATTRPSRTWT